MKYFLHDANAFQDEKITELFINYGYEGIGLFFTILERLAAQEKPIKTAVLKKQLMVGKKLEKTWTFMEEIELISSENGETFNKNLLKYSEKYQKIRENNRMRKSQQRDNQQVPKNVTHDSQGSHSPNSIVKYSNKKTNQKRTDANASIEPDLFNQFYELYGKKVDRKKSEAKFKQLSLSDQQAILEHVPHYVRSTPNVNYRKNPLTYLNGDCWKDPVDELTSTVTNKLLLNQSSKAARPTQLSNIR